MKRKRRGWRRSERNASASRPSGFEKARLERERIEKEKARLEAERKERERLEAERIEKARLDHERIEKEKARLEAEQKERDRLEAERLEKARLDRERIEKEKARLEAEQKERERLEAERLEKARIDRERIEKERAEKARLEAERRERERLEAGRLEKQRLEQERIEAERVAEERILRAAEEGERRERERLDAERAERERLQRSRADVEREERQRAEAEREEQKKREEARVKEERRTRKQQEQERLEQERLEQERLEQEQLEQERLEQERVAQQRLEQERLAKEHLEQERLEYERREQERLAHERQAQERLDQERFERERLQQERAERDRASREVRAGETAAAAGDSGWLVPPDRATFFEPPVAEGSSISPAGHAYPVYNPPADTASWTPEPSAGFDATALTSVTPPASTIRLHTGAGAPSILLESGDDSPVSRAEHRQDPDTLSAADAYEPFSTPADPQPLPWKLIAAGIVLVAATVALTQGYGPNLTSMGKTVKKAGPEAPAAVAAPVPTTEAVEPSSKTGGLTLTTEPAGIRVLVDGKAAGVTPLTMADLPPGRHVVTFQASGGSVRRTVRIEAGKTATLDLSVFSGFVAVSAPFIVEIAENGSVLGTSDNQVILGPGRHELHLSNKDLGYATTQVVEVEPGEVTRVAVDPRGVANINAVPWAEVWIDGEKAGETPLANVAIRLGVREIVFKNPQFPDRKIVTTVIAGVPSTVSVDFNKER